MMKIKVQCTKKIDLGLKSQYIFILPQKLFVKRYLDLSQIEPQQIADYKKNNQIGAVINGSCRKQQEPLESNIKLFEANEYQINYIETSLFIKEMIIVNSTNVAIYCDDTYERSFSILAAFLYFMGQKDSQIQETINPLELMIQQNIASRLKNFKIDIQQKFDEGSLVKLNLQVESSINRFEQQSQNIVIAQSQNTINLDEDSLQVSNILLTNQIQRQPQQFEQILDADHQYSSQQIGSQQLSTSTSQNKQQSLMDAPYQILIPKFRTQGSQGIRMETLEL